MDEVVPHMTDHNSLRSNLAKEGVAKIRELHRQLQIIESRIQCVEDANNFAVVQDARGHFEAAAYALLHYLDKYQSKSSLYHPTHPRAKECEKATTANPVKLAPVLQKLTSKVVQGFLASDISNQDTNQPQMTSSSAIESTTRTPRDTLDAVAKEQVQNIFSELCSDDEGINNVQLSRKKIIVHEFMSRGAFGAVHKGTYDGKPVAVKIMSDPSAFIKEVKLAATMSHPNIVQFIGVVSNSGDGFCSVMELMDGGDLRGLMDNYQESHHPPGFDFTKIKIAFHVTRALRYLHSREVPVIHRDLKSKNILLNEALDAKLTDFGVSRERIVGPMTADVGSSLWMAPEVMVGNPYDEKADMFSFGVVLSELSTHMKPYANTKVRSGANPQLVILRRVPVAMGELSVKFSEDGPQAIAKLGLACVSMNVKKRPTAVEAMHTLHSALIQEARGQLNDSCRSLDE
ncbi:hypothetical protein PF011_g22247 [Phytophthora fragariae]|uniref:Protein kinase domain-containing protein n=1 Tax=Phytophthora fragariae TaxID=53985 RepID=A0A6A3ICU4_9STRA|nr:hypothetical protein PF011_g22247 [Phytophthora fragariae]